MDNKYRYNIAQRQAIKKAKWIESEKAGRDLTFDQNFYLLWIKTYAKDFRSEWNNSSCYNCKNLHICYDQLRNDCDNFEIETGDNYVDEYKMPEML